jgi:NDP-sugar pyrophosphorylase family protein
MTVLITMAGAGTRFLRNNFNDPKHMICVKDKSLFEWSMLSLTQFFSQRFVFVCQSNHDTDWIHRKAESLGIHDIIVSQRKTLSCGQAETAYDALELLKEDDKFWIFNIDTYISSAPSQDIMGDADGCIPAFDSTDSSLSYVARDTEGFAIEIAEKKCISKWASPGLYGFKNTLVFREAYEKTYLKTSKRQNQTNHIERYVAPVYQTLLMQSATISAPIIDAKDVHILGTPEDLIQFGKSE